MLRGDSVGDRSHIAGQPQRHSFGVAEQRRMLDFDTPAMCFGDTTLDSRLVRLAKSTTEYARREMAHQHLETLIDVVCAASVARIRQAPKELGNRAMVMNAFGT